MLCANCGQPMTDGEPFCKNCGSPAPQASGTEAQGTADLGAASTQAPPPPQSFAQAPPPPPSYVQTPPPPMMMGGYGPGWQPPQPPSGRNRTGIIVGSVVGGLILLAALGAGLYFGLRGDDSGKTPSSKPTVTVATSSTGGSTATTGSTTTTEAAFVQAEGEIFLEAAGKSGPDSFTGETFVPTGPPSTLNIPTTTTTPAATATTTPGSPITIQVLTTQVTSGTTLAGAQIAAYSGDTPALYGGSKDKQLADKEGQLTFFEQNPDKAAAFCAALNSDPTFKWSGGNQIQPSQLRAYFDELTPMMLIRDTRVTNYGYRNGQPTPRQSVLQRGQLVLVDQYGVPRVRCECGNPLTPPKAVKTTPTYTGPKWPDFDPTTIIVVQPTVVIINIFVIVDINTGEVIDRPAGTEGIEDIPHMAGLWQIDVNMTWDQSAEPKALRVSTITWTGNITANPDGTLTGDGQGSWHCDGTIFPQGGGDAVGTFVGDATFTVAIAGSVVDDGSGPMLKIQPTVGGITITTATFNAPGYEEGTQAAVEAFIPETVSAAFTAELDLPAGGVEQVLATIASGGYQGGATLTPIIQM